MARKRPAPSVPECAPAPSEPFGAERAELVAENAGSLRSRIPVTRSRSIPEIPPYRKFGTRRQS
eukprot:521666-Prorocentrum_minimum.AAC.1